MTYYTGTDRWYRVAERLRLAAVSAMTRTPALTYTTAGEIAWDNCCGLLVVSVSRTWSTDVFPEEEPSEQMNCPAYLQVAEIMMENATCVPVSGDDGTPPDPVELAAASNRMLVDAAEARTAVKNLLCGLVDEDIVYYRIGEQLVFGPEGSCLGAQQRILIGLPEE